MNDGVALTDDVEEVNLGEVLRFRYRDGLETQFEGVIDVLHHQRLQEDFRDLESVARKIRRLRQLSREGETGNAVNPLVILTRTKRTQGAVFTVTALRDNRYD